MLGEGASRNGVMPPQTAVAGAAAADIGLPPPSHVSGAACWKEHLA